MAQTPLTNAAGSYLTAARLWLYTDVRPVLELLADDDTIPTQSDAEDATTDAGGRLAAALARASGDVERYALMGERYAPADLAAVVAAGGNGQAIVEGLVADLTRWALMKRRHPRLKPEDVSGAKEALETLEHLRDGETVFPTVEAVAAELPEVATIDAGDDRVTVRKAARLFGTRNWTQGK